MARPASAKSEQVADAVARDIRAGRVAQGNRLESTGASMARFAVGRNTVRRGLRMLSRQGLIATRTGIGSCVTCDGTAIDNNPGWTVAMSHGLTRVETGTLRIARAACPRTDRYPGLSPDGAAGDCLQIDRLRHCHAANHAVSLQRARLPWRAVFQDVLTLGLQEGSLNRSLQNQGLVPTAGEKVVNVIAQLGQDDAAIMARTAGDPMVYPTRVTRLADGSVLEYVQRTPDPLRFGLRLVF